MMLVSRPTHEAPLDGRGSYAAPPEALEKKPVVVVLHMEGASAGHVGRCLEANGHPLDIRRPYLGEPLPETLADHAGVVVFGGSQSANDNTDYIKQETDWVGVALKEEKPFLGVCLGGQMLARHLGAKVEMCQHGRVEIGYHPVQQLDQARVLGALPERVYQWHREGFEVPHGADLLATADGAFPNQAFIYGKAAVGIQFHPEIMHRQINAWTGSNPVRLLMRGARSREEHLTDHLVYAPRVHTWLDQFLKRWVAGRLLG
jgi:GMP synthase (glutamine-hydrolysing)